MKKLFSMIFALFMLFPFNAMAEQPKECAWTPSCDNAEKGYHIAVLSQGSGKKTNAVEITSNIHNDVVIVEGDPLISIWIPSHYDPDKLYDIFVFLQGSGENLNVTEVTATEHYGVLISDIYESIDADFIVVGIQDGSNFQEISRRILYAMSYVADHYSTYAASGKSEDLQAAREHITVGGISNGGRMATYFITHYNEYVANAIIMSPTVAMNPPEGFHLKHLFICIGTEDNVPCRPEARKSYAKLSPYAEKAHPLSVYEGRHQWKYWNRQIALALNWQFETDMYAEVARELGWEIEPETCEETEDCDDDGDDNKEEIENEQETCDVKKYIIPFYPRRMWGPKPVLR